MFFQDLKEFSQGTSIHGLGQIADDAATKTKRFLWIIIFVGSLTYAGVMLHDAYQGGYLLDVLWKAKSSGFNLRIARKSMERPSFLIPSHFCRASKASKIDCFKI